MLQCPRQTEKHRQPNINNKEIRSSLNLVGQWTISLSAYRLKIRGNTGVSQGKLPKGT